MIVETKVEDEEAEAAAEIAKATIKAPTNPVKAAKPCPICKDGFKSQWSEADEEFLWLDAKKVDGTVSPISSCLLHERLTSLSDISCILSRRNGQVARSLVGC